MKYGEVEVATFQVQLPVDSPDHRAPKVAMASYLETMASNSNLRAMASNSSGGQMADPSLLPFATPTAQVEATDA